MLGLSLSKRPFAFVLALVAALAFATASPGRANAAAGVPVFATLRQSLAIVAASDGSGLSLGTAFCIASDDKRSYFLTNQHVVKDNDVVALRLDLDKKVYKGFVLRTSVAPLDAAVIEIQRANVPALSLSADRPQAGTAIAIAGYPSIQLQTDLDPSVHEGIVNDIVEGYYIEHDAVTDHGNSGGPLFDPQTGLVYGIVTAIVPSATARAVQNNIAIVADRTSAFLGNAGVSVAFAHANASASAAPSAAATSLSANAAPATRQLAQQSAPVKLTDLRSSCLDTVKKKMFESAIDRCMAYKAALDPDIKKLDSQSATSAIPTMHDAFDSSFLLAYSHYGAGNTAQARTEARQAIFWATATFGALEESDPHLTSADDRSIHSEIAAGINALEQTFPGVTQEELKAIKAAK